MSLLIKVRTPGACNSPRVCPCHGRACAGHPCRCRYRCGCRVAAIRRAFGRVMAGLGPATQVFADTDADAGGCNSPRVCPVSWPGLARPPMSLLIKVRMPGGCNSPRVCPCHGRAWPGHRCLCRYRCGCRMAAIRRAFARVMAGLGPATHVFADKGADAGRLQFAARLPVSWPGLARPPMSLPIQVRTPGGCNSPRVCPCHGRAWPGHPCLCRYRCGRRVAAIRRASARVMAGLGPATHVFADKGVFADTGAFADTGTFVGGSANPPSRLSGQGPPARG